jgi:hypothetical protein
MNKNVRQPRDNLWLGAKQPSSIMPAVLATSAGPDYREACKILRLR